MIQNRALNKTISFYIEGIHYKTGKPVQIKVMRIILLISKTLQYYLMKSKNNIIAPGLIDNQINGYQILIFQGTI